MMMMMRLQMPKISWVFQFPKHIWFDQFHGLMNFVDDDDVGESDDATSSSKFKMRRGIQVVLMCFSYSLLTGFCFFIVQIMQEECRQKNQTTRLNKQNLKDYIFLQILNKLLRSKAMVCSRYCDQSSGLRLLLTFSLPLGLFFFIMLCSCV